MRTSNCGVGDLGPVLDVVEPLVAAELLGQLLDAARRRVAGTAGAAVSCGAGSEARHRPHATVRAMLRGKSREALAARAASQSAARPPRSGPVLSAARRLLPDHLPARRREEDGRGHAGPHLDEHDVAPGGDAAVPPLPERVPQHALDVLARVRRRDARRTLPDSWGSIEITRMTRPRRRGPSAVAAVPFARRRQPGRPDRRGGRSCPARSRPARRSRWRWTSCRACRGCRCAPATRATSSSSRSGSRRSASSRRRAGTATSSTRTSEFFADFGNYDVTIDVPARYRGKVGATGQRVDERETSDGPRALPLPPAGRPRLRVDGRPDYLVLVRHLPRGRASATSQILLYLQPEHAARPTATSRPPRRALSGYGRVLGAYPVRRRSRSWIRRGARNGAGGMEYPTLITGGHLLERAADRPAARGRDGARGRPPVLLRAARLERVRGGVARRGLQHVHDRSRHEGGLRPQPRGPLVFGLHFPLGIDIHSPLDTNRRYFEVADWDVLASDELEVPRPANPTAATVYSKTALTLATLERLARDAAMDRALRLYADRWRFRHPKTRDFIAAVNDSTGADWTWFFDRTFFSSGIVDYAVAEAAEQAGHGPARPLREGRQALAGPAAGAREGAGLRQHGDGRAQRRRGDAGRRPAALRGRPRRTARTGTARRAGSGSASPAGRACSRRPWIRTRRSCSTPTARTTARRTEPDPRAASRWTARAVFWVQNMIDFMTVAW